ncbi:MAG: hypothetical protein ACLP8S_20065 [Solirubrobacteraceae bacterium]
MAGRSRWRRAVGIASGAVVVAAVAVALILSLSSAGGGHHGVTYATTARVALTPIVHVNTQLAGALAALPAANGSAQARISAQAALIQLQTTERTLAALRVPSGDRQLATGAQTALTSEAAWLSAVVSVLSNSGSAELSQIASLGVIAQTAFATLDVQLPGASSSVPDSTQVISWAKKQNGAARTRKALSQFSSQVQTSLTQSTPAYQQINQLFNQLELAADGGSPDMDLAQVEAGIGTVISNRTSLEAAAGAISAPTPLAASTREALITAYSDSLVNDQDISNCLNQFNTGTFAIVSQQCLNATAPDAATATAAKDQFRNLYKHLRSEIGLPATDPQF